MQKRTLFRVKVVWVSVWSQVTPPILVMGMFEGPDPKAEPYIEPAPRAQE